MNRQSGWEILEQYSRKIEERRTRRARRPKLDLLHACRQGNISRYISKVGPDCGPRRGRVDAVKDEALGEATSNKAFGPGTGAVERGALGRGCASSAWLDDGESRTQTRTPSRRRLVRGPAGRRRRRRMMVLRDGKFDERVRFGFLMVDKDRSDWSGPCRLLYRHPAFLPSPPLSPSRLPASLPCSCSVV